jgi:hypothetical protein
MLRNHCSWKGEGYLPFSASGGWFIVGFTSGAMSFRWKDKRKDEGKIKSDDEAKKKETNRSTRKDSFI